MKNDNGIGEQLRSVLHEAEREHSAAEQIFAEDTGADEANIFLNGLNTTVQLVYEHEESDSDE